MSWNQSYTVPSLQVLLEKLSGISGTQLLIDHLEAKGLKITDVEDIVLDDGLYQEVKGTKITLSDGRVYLPKLVERFTADGNYGNDTYEYYLVGDEPEVKYTGESVEPEAGLTDESDLASDGDLSDEQIEDMDDAMYGGCDDDGCGCGF